MINLEILNVDNEKIGEVEVKASIFDVETKEYLFHDVVRYQMAKKRSGSASTKNRAQVSGSGIKPWRQKGTGRARAGCKRSPLWTGGGVVFGPLPRDYEHKMNKKVLNLALRSAISMRKREGNLFILQDFEIEQPKTREMERVFKRLGIQEKCLLVVDSLEHEKIILAVRNLEKVKVIDIDGLNVYDILLHNKLVFFSSVVRKVEERLER
ncbi:MAG: 50S ribosomal protein L4 [bacterium]